MIRFTTLLILMFCTGPWGIAQLEDLGFVNKDTIYDPLVATIQLYPGGTTEAMPIFQLGTNEGLTLEFDEFRDDINDYYVYIQHCDHNWEPSQLSEFDYVEGFAEMIIEDAYFSRSDGPLYNHYVFRFPNQESTVRVSGNYMMHVFRFDAEKIPTFSRQFFVVENQVELAVQLQFPIKEMGNEKQEFDFQIGLGTTDFYNPARSIWADVYQNGRTDNTIRGVKANFVGKDILKYNYIDKISFPALNEYRFVDLRTLRVKTRGVFDIQKQERGGTYEVLKRIDESRQWKPYFLVPDINGYFVIDNQDNPINSEVYTEYVDVWFNYASPYELEGKEVHLFGKFMDWEPSERSRMYYNPSISAYTKKIRLKQGYYDYAYAIVDKDSKVAQLQETEGSHYETRNFYDFLIYYRTPMERYDRIIGSKRISTRDYE